MQAKFQHAVTLLRAHRYHAIALFVVLVWSLPMLLTRNKIEWGDFSYFAQLYEAIKLSFVNYHQFPWWNPWMAGGIPLYANPQAGVFSITTILVLFLPAPFALKLTIFIFYVLGYLSFVWLLDYLSVRGLVASLLGLVWILNGFFVAHLPAHFTFIWFLVAPAFVRLALTVVSRKSGLILGAALALMALAQMHYSFVFIGFVVAVILAARIVLETDRRQQIISASLWALGLFVVVAGHRIFLTLQDASSFPRQVLDPTSTLIEDFYSFTLPFSANFGVRPTMTPYYGWTEQTAYPSIFIVAALIASIVVLYVALKRKAAREHGATLMPTRQLTYALMASGAALLIGLGGDGWFAPYSWLKHLPLLSQIRISARWFIFVDLGVLVFIGLVYLRSNLGKYYRQLILVFVMLAVAELLIQNFGYQAKILSHAIMQPPKEVSTSRLTFGQDIRFGESQTTPDGLPIPEANKQYLYREYESTLFNVGTILANEVFANLYDNDTPRCSYVAGCGLVLSHNAAVAKWTPNQIVLNRTAPGRIELDINPGSYISVNGRRMDIKQVAVLHSRFYLPVSDGERVITLTYSPRMF